MGGHFDLEKIQKEIENLELEIKQEHFWDDFENANRVNKEYQHLKKTFDNYQNLMDEIETLLLLKNDLSSKEVENEQKDIEKKILELEKQTHLTGEYDNLNCYIEIHPGAGGTESCDWANMLLRMYKRFCEKKDYQYELIYSLPGEEAGIKSALMLIKFDYAYGYLKQESGIHRLVRISPFDAGKRRHTSFASVTVTPEFNNITDVEIKENDLKIDVFHSSGAGGQSVNTSNSAVRITHLPTKITVTCQNERSQLKNKEMALKILKNKLFEQKLAEDKSKIQNLKDTSKNIDFGSQIRSYILEPYKLVKDVRSNYESNDPEKILDGDLYNMLDFNLKNIK